MARTEVYQLRLTVSEKDVIRRAAEDCGLTMAAWMRSTLLDQAKRQSVPRSRSTRILPTVSLKD